MSFDLGSLSSSSSDDDESNVVDLSTLLAAETKCPIDSTNNPDPDVGDNPKPPRSSSHHPNDSQKNDVVDDNDGNGDESGNTGMIRIVMGESVKAYGRTAGGTTGIHGEGMDTYADSATNRYMLVKESESMPSSTIQKTNKGNTQ